jgi:hypothetical protein
MILGMTTSLESRFGSGVFAVRSSRQIRLILITGQLPMMTCLRRPLHTPYKSPVGCVSRSHGWLDEVISPDVGSSVIGMTPSSRSRTHQNQRLNENDAPSHFLSPIAARQGREDEGWVKRQCESGGSATGHGNVGPPGLKRPIATHEFKQNREPSRLHTGGTPVPRFGYRKRLSVYPQN